MCREGALIMTVEARSPAGKAGLLGTRRGISGVVAGDVIVEVNGRRVSAPADIDLALDRCQVGDKVAVKYKRGIETVRSPLYACSSIGRAQRLGQPLRTCVCRARRPQRMCK